MTILYVDDISDDGAVATTTNTISVAYNLAAFNIPERQGETAVFSAGKYLCIPWPTDPPFMNFLELHSNPVLAKLLINNPELPSSIKIKLTAIIKRYNQTYDENKDNVVLVVGKPQSGLA